jgi:hypothetical protein
MQGVSKKKILCKRKNGLVLPSNGNLGSSVVQTNPSSSLEPFLECATTKPYMPIEVFFWRIYNDNCISHHASKARSVDVPAVTG